MCGVGVRPDDDRNLTRALDPLYGGEMVLNYNSRNWVIGGTVKGRGASYEYDAEGHRVSATVNGVRTRYVVNPEAGFGEGRGGGAVGGDWEAMLERVGHFADLIPITM